MKIDGIDFTGGNITNNIIGNTELTTTVERNKNFIINGNFDIWQRGASLASGNGSRYLADRFVHDAIGSTHTAARTSFTVGQNDVPNEPIYYLSTVVTSVAGASNLCSIGQSIEDVRTLAGETITLSFWAKADAAKNIATEYAQLFGAGGSTGVTSLGVTTHALTTSWQKFTVMTTLPSLSGKTIGDAANALKIHFWLDAGSDYDARTNTLGQQSGTFDIAQVQVERGSEATTFSQRVFADEVILCQRYYSKSFDIPNPPVFGAGLASPGIHGATFNVGGDLADVVMFPVSMRIPPSIGLFNPVVSSGTWRSTNNTTTATAAVSGVGNRSFRLGAGSGLAEGGHEIHWTADAEF